METKKAEVSQLIESLGNEPKHQNASSDFVEWLNKANPMEQTPKAPGKKNCKSGNCGNNKKTAIIVAIIVFMIMLAGYGFFTLIGDIFK